MSDLKRSFGTWAKTECDECHCVFQVTRTEPREFTGKITCNDCEVYVNGYSDGAKSMQQEIDKLKADNDKNARIINKALFFMGSDQRGHFLDNFDFNFESPENEIKAQGIEEMISVLDGFPHHIDVRCTTYDEDDLKDYANSLRDKGSD